MCAEFNHLSRVRQQLQQCSLIEFELIDKIEDDANFGGQFQYTFRNSPLALRITKDRGSEFVDIGSSRESDRFFQYIHVEVAFGWRNDDVLKLDEAEDLSFVLSKISERYSQLVEAFSPSSYPNTLKIVSRAEKEQGEQFMKYLTSLRPAPSQ